MGRLVSGVSSIIALALLRLSRVSSDELLVRSECYEFVSRRTLAGDR